MQAAIALAERGAALHESRPAGEATSADHSYALAQFLYAAERWEEARELFEELAAEHPDDVDYRGYLGALAARRGDRPDALAVSAWLERNEHPYWAGGSTYSRARIAALLGEREQAVELLRDALAEGAWLFFGLLAHTDMDLEPLRDYPPFQEFMRPKG
jgi:predicted Zn-dependent protease